MNHADPRWKGGDATPLRLRLVHSHGNARNGVLSVAAVGAGMAEALELCGERLNDGQWRAANLCRIAWQGDGRGWQLANDSHMLVCAVNGERAEAGMPVAIAVGDTLELGLLRFLVEAGEGEALQAAHGKPIGMTPARHPVVAPIGTVVPAPGADERSAFDLCDLAVPANGEPHANTLEDPFGVLDIAGAKARPVADLLSDLLGEASPVATPAARHADSPQPAVRETDPAHKERTSAANEAPLSRAAAALFDELHDEFVRVVRDPTQLAGRTDWEGFLALDGEPAPTLEEMSREAEPYPLLRDIVKAREGIDQVIENFDPLGRSSLLDEEGSEDVLRLFAPELARNAKAPMPSLTRREHHALSPDSHMHLGPSRPDDKDASP